MTKVVYLLVLSLWTLYAQDKDEMIITQKDWVMTTDEMTNFANNAIMSALLRSANDMLELPTIRNRIVAFLTKKDKEISVLLMQSYFLSDKRMLLRTDWDKKAKLPRIIIFTPAFRDLQRSRPNRFPIEVPEIFAHEMIHYEHRYEFPMWNLRPLSRRDYAKSEGVAWGLEILEISRPRELRGIPMLPFHKKLSDGLRACGDNIRSSCWNSRFVDYPR